MQGLGCTGITGIGQGVGPMTEQLPLPTYFFNTFHCGLSEPSLLGSTDSLFLPQDGPAAQ